MNYTQVLYIIWIESPENWLKLHKMSKVPHRNINTLQHGLTVSQVIVSDDGNLNI